MKILFLVNNKCFDLGNQAGSDHFNVNIRLVLIKMVKIKIFDLANQIICVFAFVLIGAEGD